MNEAMGNCQEDENEEDIQDKILKAIQARKMRGKCFIFCLYSNSEKYYAGKIWKTGRRRKIQTFPSIFNEADDRGSIYLGRVS